MCIVGFVLVQSVHGREWISGISLQSQHHKACWGEHWIRRRRLRRPARRDPLETRPRVPPRTVCPALICGGPYSLLLTSNMTRELASAAVLATTAGLPLLQIVVTAIVLSLGLGSHYHEALAASTDKSAQQQQTRTGEPTRHFLFPFLRVLVHYSQPSSFVSQ